MALLVIRPFIISILTSFVVAYIFFPLYRWIYKKTNKMNFSAFIVTLLIILLMSLPVVYIVTKMGREVPYIYVEVRQTLQSGVVFGTGCEENPSRLCDLGDTIKELYENERIKIYIDKTLKEWSTKISGQVPTFLESIPEKILKLFVIFFLVFYLLKDGNHIKKFIMSILPLRIKYKTRLQKRFSEITYGVIYGQIISAIVQGATGALGFFIIGIFLQRMTDISTILVNSPILLFLLMSFFALIPMVGPMVVYVPISAYQIISGLVDKNVWFIGSGIAVFLFGFLIVSSIDNIIKPKIIGNKANIHPALVFLGVLGGLAWMGFIGIIIGPLILAMLLTFIYIYKEEKGARN